MIIKKEAIIIGIFLIIAGVLLFNIADSNITGGAIKDPYLSTTAICNETNFCQDYEVICQDDQVLSMTPISGAVVQHSPDWEDHRNETENLCK